MLSKDEFNDVRHFETCFLHAVGGDAFEDKMGGNAHVVAVVTGHNLHVLNVNAHAKKLCTIPLQHVRAIEDAGSYRRFTGFIKSHDSANRHGRRYVLTRAAWSDEVRAAADAADDDDGERGRDEHGARAEMDAYDREKELQRLDAIANRKAAIANARAKVGKFFSRLNPKRQAKKQLGVPKKDKTAAAANDADGAPAHAKRPSARRRFDRVMGKASGKAGAVTESFTGGAVTESFNGFMRTPFGKSAAANGVPLRQTPRLKLPPPPPRYLTQNISIVTMEPSSQLMFHLKHRVLETQAQVAVLAAKEEEARGRGGGGRGGGGQSAESPPPPPATSSRLGILASRLPRDVVDGSELATRAVYDAETSTTRATRVSYDALSVAAGMADFVDRVHVDVDGFCHFGPPSRALPPPPGTRGGSAAAADVVARDDDAPTQGDVNRAKHEAKEGLLLCAALHPAMLAAAASLRATRRAEDAERVGIDPWHDLMYAREVFDDLESEILAPKYGELVGSRIVPETCTTLDVDDVNAIAAMSEHFKRSPKLQSYALVAVELFDVVMKRLAEASWAASHTPGILTAMRKRRRGKQTGVDNWARMFKAVAQGSAAHRTVQMLTWTRSVLEGSEGAVNERTRIITGEPHSLESLVHALFTFSPRRHPSMKREKFFESASMDLTKLRHPDGAVSIGVLDLIVHVLFEVIMLCQHAFMAHSGKGHIPSKFLVEHIIEREVSDELVSSKISAMFARLANLVLFDTHGPIRGGDAVCAHRYAFVLQHFIDGFEAGRARRAVLAAYEHDLTYVLSQPWLRRRNVEGDVFFDVHARPMFNRVMRECIPRGLMSPTWELRFGRAENDGGDASWAAAAAAAAAADAAAANVGGGTRGFDAMGAGGFDAGSAGGFNGAMPPEENAAPRWTRTTYR